MRTTLLVSILVLACIPAAGADEPRIRSAFDFVRAHGYVTFPDHPHAPLSPPKLSPDYLVGDTREFWSWDLSVMPPRDVLVPSTCRAVGANAYIFVADDQWNVNVTQQDVDLLIDILDNRTPPGSIDPAKGIIPNEVDVFGPVPDALDGDPKPIILLMELASYGGTQFDGYFNAFNQYPNDCHADDCYHSNECEMITVNSAIRPVTSDMSVSILAHEFQHLIHWGGDPDEVNWVNESCSEAAMVVCGYNDSDWMNSYLMNPSVRLDETDPAKINYGVYLLFGTYLYERFGSEFMQTLVADPTHGQTGMTGSLSASGHPLSMDELLLDWATATVGDHLGASDPLYSHPLIAVGAPAMVSQVVAYPLDPPLQRSLAGTGTAYVRLAAPAGNPDVLLGLQAQPAGNLQARVLMVDGSGNAVTVEFVQGEATVPFADNPGIDSAYLVMVASIGGQVSYTLTAETVSDGEDGGVADAGDGGDVSDTDTDAGADTSDGGSVTDEGTGDGDGGCGCGTGAGQSLPLLLLFVFLPLRFRLRYPVGR